MNKPTIDEILAPKPEVRPRIYAYSIADEAHKGLLKMGQTVREVKQRIAEQLKTPAIKNYTIELDESAERDDGTVFTDHEVKRVLVVTFKPAVEDAWQTDLECHVDFDGWQYLSKSSGSDPTQISRSKPLVYFGSFQDLLGHDPAGNIKPKNEWIHKVKWDLVVFDEYYFGAWRETAKELFEGEEEAVAKKEAKLEYGSGLDNVNIAMAGTSATLLARKWESALLVNVDNDTLRRVLDNPEALAAVERIEGWRALGDNILVTIINKSEKLKDLKNKAKDKELTALRYAGIESHEGLTHYGLYDTVVAIE